ALRDLAVVDLFRERGEFFLDGVDALFRAVRSRIACRQVGSGGGVVAGIGVFLGSGSGFGRFVLGRCGRLLFVRIFGAVIAAILICLPFIVLLAAGLLFLGL